MTPEVEQLVKAIDLDRGIPFVPEELRSSLEEVRQGLYATRSIEASPFDIGSYVREFLENANIADYLISGVDGYAAETWADHFYLLQKPLALFIQIGRDPDSEEDDTEEAVRDSLEELLALAETIAAFRTEIGRALEEGRIARHDRFVVVQSDIYGSRWGCLPARADFESFEWREEEPTLQSAFDLLISDELVVPQVEQFESLEEEESEEQADEGNVGEVGEPEEEAAPATPRFQISI